ncbi:TasA family protein, partial [Bacillus sp. SIMBA_008]
MNKKLTGIVAGAAGAALLLSGGTYALWYDSAEAPGGTITAGNLDVAA